jgi:tetratricopeptide (TPR) repeat protein
MKPLLSLPPPRRRALALAALFLLAFGAYLRSLSPAFHPDDSPETITACVTLSVQHPPGYPLHSLLGRLAVLLGPGPAAFNVNAFSAFAASLALLLGALILRELAREFAPWACDDFKVDAFALAGALALGATHQLFFQATIAKGGIYSLNLALSFGTLLCLLRARDALLRAAVGSTMPSTALSRIALAALLFGLGMAHHWTSQVVLLPSYAALLAEPLYLRRFRRPRLASLLPILLAPWAGLALYAFLPIRARLGAPLIWSDAGGLKDLLWVFLRSQYAGVESAKTFANFKSLLAREAEQVLSNWTWPGLLALVGAWVLLLRKRPWLGGALLALPLSLGLAVAWKANPPSDSYFIIDPYLVPLHAGLGLGLAGWVALTKWRERLGPALLAGAVALWAWQWRKAAHTNDYLGWDYVQNLLLSAPKHALLFCEGDSNTAGPLLPRYGQGRRRDLVLAASVLLDYPWYQARLAALNPGLKVPGRALGSPGAVMAWMVAENTERPALWTNSYTRAWVDESALLHRGLLLRRQAVRRPFPAALLRSEDISAAYALRGVFEPEPVPMDALSVRLVRDNYIEAAARLAQAYLDVQAWDDAARIYRRLGVRRSAWAPPWLQAGNARWYAGDVDGAERDWVRAAQEDPGSAEAWANQGLVAFERRDYDKAASLARRALALAPDLPNAKELLQKALQASVSAPTVDIGRLERGRRAAARADALAGKSRFAEALQAYEEALALGFNNAALQRNRGVMLGQLGRPAEAAEALRQAVALDPSNAELHKLHGFFLFNSGRRVEGLAELEKALKLAPQDAEIQRLVNSARQGIP